VSSAAPGAAHLPCKEDEGDFGEPATNTVVALTASE
jgi:hypothetical protein